MKKRLKLICCLLWWWNWSDRFVLITPKLLCIQLSFILETYWEIWIYNNYLLNPIYVLDLRTLVLCATICVMYSKCSKILNVRLWCMFVWWISCSLSFSSFVGWLGETGLTGFAPDTTHLFVLCLLLVITHVICITHLFYLVTHTCCTPLCWDLGGAPFFLEYVQIGILGQINELHSLHTLRGSCT
jgi:hypothetical protein